MPKIITILARIENSPDAVIMYYAIAALMFSPIFVLFGPRIKAFVLPNHSNSLSVITLIAESPAKNAIFV